MRLTGCHLFNDDEPSIDRSSGPLSEQRYQWTAGPGIDLVTGPAVPIRAYMESRMDAQTMGTIDYAYPGFDRAVATKSADGDQDLFGSSLRPDEDTGAVSRAAVGNNRFLIQSLTRGGQTVTATLCNYRYGLAHEQENGTFVSVLNKAVNDQGIDTLRVRLTAPANESNNAFPHRAAPRPRPLSTFSSTGRSRGCWATSDGFIPISPRYGRPTRRTSRRASRRRRTHRNDAHS